MDRLSPWFAAHWSAVLLVFLAGFAAWRGLRKKQQKESPDAWYHVAAGLGLLALGGLILPWTIGIWIGGTAALVLFGMLLVVILNGHWLAQMGYAVGAIFLIGLGSAGAQPASEGLNEVGKLLRSLEVTQPFWLVLLLLIPVIIRLSYRSLAGLGPIRRWVAIGLRCSLILFLTLALAEVRVRHQNENITVLFLIDRTFSIPIEGDAEANPESPQIPYDRRAERIERFINDSVEKRGPGHERDRTGVILFGRRPRLELPASDAPRLNFRFKDLTGTVDGNYTDIAAAIKLALASFPEGYGKRIVLLSDGNENLGNAEEQARMAERNGVQIDVVPLASGVRKENEVLVESVDAPARTEQGARVPIRVQVRSHFPRTVVGTLTLRQTSEGVTEQVTISPSTNVLEIGPPARVRLLKGVNTFSFKQKLDNRQQSYTYEATFQPEFVENDQKQLVRGLTGDRVQNNNASTHIIASGQRRILVIEQTAGDHDLLVERLREIGNSKYKVYPITVQQLPRGKGDLGLFLSGFDCVLMANVPAEEMSDEQQEMLRSNTFDQGCGLVMIGGPDSFGAGGWQGTPVEKALPVDCDIKSLQIQGKGGLVLIMHASEMADGNRWQKEIGKLAIKKLSPVDEVGVIDYDFQHKWHIPLQVIGSKRSSLMALVDRMQPGDMPDFDAPLKMAYDRLTEPERELATKHVIIISDGDPGQNNRNLLANMKSKKVTVTTVGVATHGASQDQALKSISDATGGRFYKVTNPRALPSIYIKETRIVSQSFLYEKRFQPRLVYRGGPADKLPDALLPLHGFVRTTPKSSPTVEVPIQGPPSGEQDFPLLAYWHYGLGKSVAFTSDARSSPTKNRRTWDQEWADSEIYSRFWEHVVDWACRSVETGQLAMTTEYRDGKVRVLIDARDANNRPITDLNLRGGVTTPGMKDDDPRRMELRFEQKNSGMYEAEFKADEAGSYFINAQSMKRKKVMRNGKEEEVEEGADSIRTGVTIPYSPEFADLESNKPLLEKLAGITKGQVYVDEEAPLVETAKAGEVYRSGLPQFKNLQPIWFWLVFLTGTLLFFDVAVRRIAVDPLEVTTAANRLWSHLRGRAAQSSEAPQYFERLRSRKAQVSESIEQQSKSTRRFEGDESAATGAPAGAQEVVTDAPPLRPTAPRPGLAPEKKQEPEDYASRLLKAKKRVWQERDPDKPG